MSGEALGWARRQTVSGGLVAKAVLLLLADYCGEDHACWPSVPTLARELQSHERTVQRALSSLEADRLIGREARATGRGKTTSNRIRLDVECLDGGQARGGGAPPSPPAERHPGGGTAPPSPPAQRHPHMNHQFKPGLEQPFADAQGASARADGEIGEVSEVEGAFGRFMADYPASGLERTDWARARTAFAEQLSAADAVSDGDGMAVLVAAAATYRASTGLAKGDHGAVNAVTFLAGERWRSFLPGTAAAQAVAALPPRFADIQVRAAVALAMGEDFTAAYLDAATLDDAARTITPRTRIAAERLKAGLAGKVLEQHGVKIMERAG